MVISRRDFDTYVTYFPSNKPPVSGVEPLRYTTELCRSGKASCSCPDFQTRGGACKHLCSVRLCVDYWITSKQETTFLYPQSRKHAEEIHCSQQPALSEHQTTPTSCDLRPSPPAAHPEVIAWDPVSIQALGGDLTTIDADEILEVESESDDEYEITVSLFRSQLRSTKKFDLHIQNENEANRSVITGQIQAKVGHDVHRLLPSLHGLANLLSDEHSIISKSAELVELSKVLSSIQLALDNVLHPTTTSGSLLPAPTDLLKIGRGVEMLMVIFLSV